MTTNEFEGKNALPSRHLHCNLTMIVGGITTYDYFRWGENLGCGIPEAEDGFMSSVRRGGEEGFHGRLSHPGPDLLDIRPELEVGVARVRDGGGPLRLTLL